MSLSKCHLTVTRTQIRIQTPTRTCTGTRHERLVMFLGCGIDEGGGCFLVTEFMDGGSLDRVLWGDSSTTLCTSWMQRIQILLDVVDGLAYLHLMHKSIHQDLKSPNILLEKIVQNDDAARRDDTVTHRAKLADFGLSRIFSKGKKRIGTTDETKKSSKKAILAANWESMQLMGFVGTPRWMAPEMMHAQTKIGPSVDIYSFGVVMWEVWSQRKPWSELSTTQDIFKAVRDEKRTLPSLDNKDDENVPDGYDDLMKRCLKYNANQRPLIDSVRHDLQDLREGAAKIDREKSLHLQPTRRGSLARSNVLFKMMSDIEEETKSSNLQGSNSTTSSVEIEMESMA